MPDTQESERRLIESGTLLGRGFLLVQISVPQDLAPVWGTLVVDLRAPSGAPTVRIARASVDYDPANGRHVRCAAVTMPHQDSEQFAVYVESDESPARADVIVLRMPFE